MISTARRRPPRLETVRRRLDRWRRRRPHARAPLPPQLWAAAVTLVPEHGVYATARALGISYGALKQHVDREGRHAYEPTAAGFLELPAPPVREAYVVEIESGRVTVRVRLPGLALSELAEFTRLIAGATS